MLPMALNDRVPNTPNNEVRMGEGGKGEGEDREKWGEHCLDADAPR